MLRALGGALARFLSKARSGHTIVSPTPEHLLRACLRPGDVLLVEGTSRISTAIKYLTQSTWSHAALFVGFANPALSDPELCFVEADTVAGVRAVPLGEYAGLATRICRPVGIAEEDAQRVIEHALARLGHHYDLRNVVDLARYLFPMPPVPARFRRQLIELGSGDPTRAICSTLIAEAFQSIQYPIMPRVEAIGPLIDLATRELREEVLHDRHHSLLTPRDFDVSPYFEIVKPTLASGFNFRKLFWAKPPAGG
jgi:hypothetical protein